MKIVFCSDPLNNKVADMEYEHEYRCARKLGLDVHLISLESVLDGNLSQAVKQIPTFETPERFIYRGWMLKPHNYEQLYDALQQKNATLINSPSEYRNGHYFPYPYEAIKKITPHNEAIYHQGIPELDSFTELAKGVASQFFTMDIAKTASGEWTVIEIGDGQVSGLPNHADTEQFYQSIVDSEIN